MTGNTAIREVTRPTMKIGNDNSAQVSFNPEKNAASFTDTRIFTCTSGMIFSSSVQPRREYWWLPEMVVKAKLNHHNWQLSWVTTQRQVISHKANENGLLKSTHVWQQLWAPGAICFEMCISQAAACQQGSSEQDQGSKGNWASCWRFQKAPLLPGGWLDPLLQPSSFRAKERCEVHNSRE